MQNHPSFASFNPLLKLLLTLGVGLAICALL